MIDIAVFPRDVDALLMRIDKTKYRFHYLVPVDTREEKWINQFIDKQDILYYHFDDTDGSITDKYIDFILNHSDIDEILHKRCIPYLFITAQIKPEIQKWSDIHNIQLIFSPLELQRRYENKIWFDGFLYDNNLPKPDSIITTLEKGLPDSGWDTSVVQIPDSSGSMGTFIIDNNQSLQKLMKEGMLSDKDQYQIRKFISGKTYGISVFISRKEIALSTLRLQCFDKNVQEPVLKFIGLQWVNSKELSATVITMLNKIFIKIGLIMRSEGYFGYANFDFIIDAQDNIYILECNARFSDASIILIQFPELLSKCDTIQLFIDDFMDKNLDMSDTPIIHKFPIDTFEGSLIVLDADPEVRPIPINVKRQFDNGVYTFDGSLLKYKTPDIRTFARDNYELTYNSDAEVGEEFTKHTTISYILSSFPAYDANGRINDQGLSLIELFSFTGDTD